MSRATRKRGMNDKLVHFTNGPRSNYSYCSFGGPLCREDVEPVYYPPLDEDTIIECVLCLVMGGEAT